MEVMQPVIRIQWARFLTPIFNGYNKVDATQEKFKLDVVVKRIDAQRVAWAKDADVILRGLQELLELTFFENLIKVYVVPAHKGAFSDPIVMSSLIAPEQFPDILTHELIHRLSVFNRENCDVSHAIRQVLPNITDQKVYVHVFVHAFHKAIYLDILRDEKRLQRDIETSAAPAYQEAWNIVEERGYKELMSEFKKYYK